MGNYFKDGGSWDPINGGEIAGAALSGATSGLFGQGLEDLALRAGLKNEVFDWANDILGNNLGLVGSFLGGELCNREK